MKSLRDELIKLENLGVEFTSQLYGGEWHVLTVDEVCDLSDIGDKDKFIIKQLGITEQHLRLWRVFTDPETSQCHGTTRKGERCKNRLQLYEVNISNFDPEYDLYCPLHKPH